MPRNNGFGALVTNFRNQNTTGRFGIFQNNAKKSFPWVAYRADKAKKWSNGIWLLLTQLRISNA